MSVSLLQGNGAEGDIWLWEGRRKQENGENYIMWSFTNVIGVWGR